MSILWTYNDIEKIKSEIMIDPFSSSRFECFEYSLDLNEDFSIDKVVSVKVSYFSNPHDYKTLTVPGDSTGGFHLRVLLGDSSWSAINDLHDIADRITHEQSQSNNDELMYHVVDEISSRMSQDFNTRTRAMRVLNTLSAAADSRKEPLFGPPVANGARFLIMSLQHMQENAALLNEIFPGVKRAWSTGDISPDELHAEVCLLELIEKNTEWFIELKLYNQHKDIGLKSKEVIPRDIEKNCVEVR